MREFNRLMEYREYYIYDTDNEVFCIATGPKHNEALELYTQIADRYFKDEHNRWEFEVALDCVHNFSDEDIQTTLRVARAMEAVEITLADHIVVADDDYVSMALSGFYRVGMGEDL